MNKGTTAGAPESKHAHHGAPKQQFSSRNNPCPICDGRDGSCETDPTGVSCGHSPADGPWGGDHRKGPDGRHWNFAFRDDQGRACFSLHRFRSHTPQNLDDVRGHLCEAITEDGLSDSELHQLVAQLAKQVKEPVQVVQRIADGIQTEQRHVAEVQAEALALAAEAQRQEIGQKLTPDFLLPAKIAAARPRPFAWCKSGGPTALIRE